MAQFFLSFSLGALLALATLSNTRALQLVVVNRASNTSGGVRFRNEIGGAYALQTMVAATKYIWNAFQQSTAADRKNVPRVTLFLDDMNGVAYASNNEIHFSTNYIQGIKGDLKTEFNGVIYHEMTHVWQWNGNGQAPGWLIEGIADYLRLKAGYVANGWVKSGGGDRWDQGYSVTARFLDYCTGIKQGFVAELNNKMRNGYSDNFFGEMLGKPVDQLWKDYKAKFAN